MPDIRYQVALHAQSNLPEDDHVNVLYYATDDVAATSDDIAAAYQTAAGIFNGWWNQGLTIKAYAMAGGQPIRQEDYTFAAQGGSGPTEVAMCLSYASVDDPESSTPRRRGRIYIGTPSSGVRPALSLVQNIQNFGLELGSLGVGTAQTWKLYSPTDGVTADIESIWVDDSWDTQRRRGIAPSARYVSDVQ